MTLSERRSRILTFIVDDYVDSATPVGSQALVERHALSLSSATVRNEMAALESEGMITHPHTSAGRIPSHRGYRYYVSSLMREPNLSPQERLTILHQFHQSARELERWVGLAASVLANSMQTLALATQPRVREVRLKQLQLVELSEYRALLVVVTNEAAVRQHTLDLPAPANQDALSRLAAQLNASLGGLTAAELAARADAEPLAGVEAVVVGSVAEILLREQDAMAETPVVEGIRDLLRKPEFDESDRMLDTLEAVDERHLRRAIPLDALEHGQVAIVIGDENREGPYQDMSFVLAHYGPPGGAGGIVGLLGPTRIAYGDAVAHVRYVSELLTGLMSQFYEE
ncbi:MAG: heat-inducible transcription repressor HrcA [Thermoflexaceae bacterium]|nr:heat-inducible transcription repressor HrcA [Thermoflexaceae bacterium]